MKMNILKGLVRGLLDIQPSFTVPYKGSRAKHVRPSKVFHREHRIRINKIARVSRKRNRP
jgi:hypothetical protein